MRLQPGIEIHAPQSSLRVFVRNPDVDVRNNIGLVALNRPDLHNASAKR